MSSTAWRDEAFRTSYDDTLASLTKRRNSEPDFSVDSLRGILKHLYEQDGNDQFGRGELQDLILRGIIEAHEDFLAGWESERRQ
ncbi:MAG TPA: hypothetical protein PK625_10780 [Spirochaetales bacterium]|nr:hypothetical protein [Spirochaetales bacterium]